MKFLIFNTDYADFIDSVYKKNPGLKKLPYDQEARQYFGEFFGTSNYYSTNLNQIGHEAHDVVINNEYLQKKWLAEAGIKYSTLFSTLDGYPVLKKIKRKYLYFPNEWYYKAMEEQINFYKPDVVYVQLGAHLSPHFLQRIKKKVKLLAAQIASPLPKISSLKNYDLIFTSLPHYVEIFRKAGIKSEYLQLAFDESVLKKLSKINGSAEVVHIGGYGPIHNERNAILEQVAEGTGMKFWGNGTGNLDPQSPILKNFMGAAWGLKMYNVLFNSKITTTKHISYVADKYANNMTLYEATGVGAMLITDWKENLDQIFKVGREVETYKTAQELEDKIKYYLSHESERQAIAEAGQRRTLRDHTYKIRMGEIVAIIQKYL